MYPLDDVDASNTPSTAAEERDYRLRIDITPASSGINTGDPDIELGFDAGYFPRDEFDVDDDGVTEKSNPYEVTPALDADRVLAEVIDRGAFERPCDLTTDCPGDCVKDNFQPPGDGYVNAADLAILLGDWCDEPNCCRGCCSDTVTSSTFAPPPDGIVDGADLAFLLAAWGPCPCDDPYAQGLMGGGESGGGDSSSGAGGSAESAGESGIDLGPYAGTYFGLLLEELIATSDDELAAIVAEFLAEMMNE